MIHPATCKCKVLNPTRHESVREDKFASSPRRKIFPLLLEDFLFIMDFKDSLSGGVFFGFIPHRLEMKQFPEFYNFPYNVLFARWRNKDGKRVSGSAIYEPEFWTYKKEDNISSMRYHNIYGGDSCLMIAYDEKDQKYRGEKWMNGKSVGFADGGADWNKFFVQLTALGLFQGERCEFKDAS